MNAQEFEEIIALGHEQRGVEFKRGGSRKSDKQLLAKVIRAIIGMANRRDGGRVILGVDEDSNGAPIPTGITDGDLATWSYDDFADSLAEYVDPNISFELEVAEARGKKFLVIHVYEFEDIPVLCKKDYPQITRAGACYVRARRKPETLEIPTQTDMRDLLDLAIEKGVRKFVAQVQTAGLTFSDTMRISDAQLFDNQISDILRLDVNTLLQKIHSRGYWQVIIRPAKFTEKRIEDITELYPILQKTYVSLRGWDCPHLDPRTNPRIDFDWIEQQSEWEHYLSLWRFYQSGQFFYTFGMPFDWRDQSHFWPVDEKWKPGTLLGVGDAIATFTEVLEFAARLSLSQAGDDQMHIHIVVGNLAGRHLLVDSPNRWPMDEVHQASIEKYPYSLSVEKSDLVAKPREIAIELSSELFKRFGWRSNADLLRGWQDGLKR